MVKTASSQSAVASAQNVGVPLVQPNTGLAQKYVEDIQASLSSENQDPETQNLFQAMSEYYSQAQNIPAVVPSQNNALPASQGAPAGNSGQAAVDTGF